MKKTLQKLKEKIKQLKDNELKRYLVEIPLSDLVDFWDTFDEDESLRIFQFIDKDKKLDLMNMLNPSKQEELLKSLSTEHVKILLEEIKPDDLTDLIQAVSPEIREAVWQSLSPEARKEAQFLLHFDQDDAAGLMTPRYLAIRSHLTVAQALSWVRKNLQKVETVYYIYVVDQLRRLIGVISLKDILSADDNDLIEQVMVRNVTKVHEETDQEEVAKILESYDLLALPVVDSYNRLLGIITFDDIIDVIREEQTEDIYKMGAMGGSTKPYLESSVWALVKKRIPWLVILLIAATLTANVIELYQPIYIAAVFLVPFIPLITGTGGNSGTQSSTLMIRGLATGELHFHDIGRVILKEVLVGLMIGVVLGILAVIRSVIFGQAVGLWQGLTIGVAMTLVVMVATLIGAVAPLIIHKLGADPTVMAGPLMATVIDVCGLTLYFETARFMLNFAFA